MNQTYPMIEIKMQFAIRTEITRKPEAKELADTIADRLMLVEHTQLLPYYELNKNQNDGTYQIVCNLTLIREADLQHFMRSLENQLKSVGIEVTWT